MDPATGCDFPNQQVGSGFAAAVARGNDDMTPERRSRPYDSVTADDWNIQVEFAK